MTLSLVNSWRSSALWSTPSPLSPSLPRAFLPRPAASLRRPPSSPTRTAPARVGAARDYYEPERVAQRVHAKGLYLIGRVVVFEDPYLARERPKLAVQSSAGGIWTNYGGLGWSNQYDERVWEYNVDIPEAAARAGLGEIMVGSVRLPAAAPAGNGRAMPVRTAPDPSAWASRRSRPTTVDAPARRTRRTAKEARRGRA